MSKLRLAMEYGGDPIWEIFADGSNNLNHDELPLSDELKQDLWLWAEEYESTFDADYPPNGNFASQAQEEAFEQRGRSLWHRLRQELSPEILLEPYQTHGAGVARKTAGYR